MQKSFNYQIYYEDTDFGGVVYYANYLKFFERARTDFLRSKNIIQSQLAEKSGIMFVVGNCNVQFLSPAKMDDLVEVSVEVLEVKKASIKLYQEMKLGEKILAKIEIQIICVDSKSFKPRKIPEGIF